MTNSVTPAEVKTAIESLGLTHDRLAETAGMSPARLYALVTPDRTLDVPDSLAAAVLGAQDSFTAAADRMASEFLSDPEAEVLYRHTAADYFWKAVPELAGWPFQSQGLLLAEVRRRIDRPVRIVWAEQ